MFSFVQFELLNRAPYSAIVNVKRIEPEAISMQAQPPCSYILHLTTGTVRHWLRAIEIFVSSVLKLTPEPLV